jgi:hypothetical protein
LDGGWGGAYVLWNWKVIGFRADGARYTLRWETAEDVALDVDVDDYPDEDHPDQGEDSDEETGLILRHGEWHSDDEMDL